MISDDLKEQDILHYHTLGSKRMFTYLFTLVNLPFIFLLALVLMEYPTIYLIGISGAIIGIISVSVVYVIFIRSILKEVFSEGAKMENKKDKLIFEAKFIVITKREIIPLWISLIITIIVFISIVSYLVLYPWVIDGEILVRASVLPVAFGVFYLMYPSIRERYIWIYRNGIGIQFGYTEKVHFTGDINSIYLRKKEDHFIFKLQTKSSGEIKLELKGEKMDELINILQKTFKDLTEIECC